MTTGAGTTGAGTTETSTWSEATPQELVEQGLALATLPCVVLVTERTEANLRWASNGLTTNGEMTSRTVTVIATAPVTGGTAVGTVGRELGDPADLPSLVAAAESLARSGPSAEDAADLVADYAHGDPYDSAPASTDIGVFATVAPALGTAFSAAESAGHRLFGFAEHIVSTTYLGSTTGLRRRAVQPTGRIELNAKSPDFADSAWVGAATEDFTDVDVATLYADVVTRLGWSATRIDLPAGRYETLLPPSAVADLMIYLYWTASARDAEEGRTVFAAGEGRTRIGERLSPLPITLSSDPHRPGIACPDFVATTSSGEGLTSVFDNGLPTPRTDWIVDGVLTDLLRNRAWAARTSTSPSAPIDNLIMEAGGGPGGRDQAAGVGADGPVAGVGTATLDEMIAGTKRGLLLTCLWYIREVDPERLLLTGLTRDGVYLVEDGKVVGAVNNFRFNESPVDLLRRIIEIGASEQTLCREWNDYFTRTIMPPVRVPDFNMSTVSQAS